MTFTLLVFTYLFFFTVKPFGRDQSSIENESVIQFLLVVGSVLGGLWVFFGLFKFCCGLFWFCSLLFVGLLRLFVNFCLAGFLFLIKFGGSNSASILLYPP